MRYLTSEKLEVGRTAFLVCNFYENANREITFAHSEPATQTGVVFNQIRRDNVGAGVVKSISTKKSRGNYWVEVEPMGEADSEDAVKKWKINERARCNKNLIAHGFGDPRKLILPGPRLGVGARNRADSSKKQMEINIAELASLLRPKTEANEPSRFWVPGAKYFIRTVTHHHTGVLVEVNDHEILIEQAAWIADDGRLTDSLQTGDFHEVEMFLPGMVCIGRGSLIDAQQIKTIPVSQK